MRSLRRSSFLLVVAWLMGCGGVFEAQTSRGRWTKAREVESCPLGHKTLADVPIEYGTPIAFGKEEKDLTPDDKEYLRKLKAREIIWGGCVVGDRSPQWQVTCQTCRYGLIQVSPTLPPCWCHSAQVDGVIPAFYSDVMKSLPLPDQRLLAEAPQLSQTMEGSKIQEERLEFHLDRGKVEPWRLAIVAWSDERGLTQRNEKARAETGKGLLRRVARINGIPMHLDVDVYHSNPNGQALVRCLIFRPSELKGPYNATGQLDLDPSLIEKLR